MKTINTELSTYRGTKSDLIETIRNRRGRRMALRLTPVAGSQSKYKVYAGGNLVGETVIRSAKARQSLTTSNGGYATIGWDNNRNETLIVNISC